MQNDEKNFKIFVDTSYLTRMPATEKVEWNKLLELSIECGKRSNVKQNIGIFISEIALRELRCKMLDELIAKIDQARTRLDSLQEEWQKNEVAKKLVYPFPKNRDIFPQKKEIETAADEAIESLISKGVKKVKIQEHHKDAVWENYFDWLPPFDAPSPAQRSERAVREKRRIHIPDAWILEAAMDTKDEKSTLLCLCIDGNLSKALKVHNYDVYQSAKEILDILISPTIEESAQLQAECLKVSGQEIHPLDLLLTKAPNEKVKNIFLRLLGFVEVMDTPRHEELINAVVSIGFDSKLAEACAVILSENSNPYLKNTGSHYIVGNNEICSEAAERLTQEIVDMLE